MIGVGFIEFLIIIIIGLPVVLSPVWFAFTKGKRVRWGLVIGWLIFGFFMALGNLHRMSEDPLPIVLIGYPIGVAVGFIFLAGVYKVIGTLCIRFWRFLKPKVLSLVREIRS